MAVPQKRGRGISRPLSRSSVLRLSPVCGSNRAVALSTIHRSVLSRFKRHFSIDATLGTYRGIHPSRAAETFASFRFSGRTATGTTFGIVSETFTSEELLFISTEGKGSPTIDALQFPVCETHWMTSFFKNCELNFGHPIT